MTLVSLLGPFRRSKPVTLLRNSVEGSTLHNLGDEAVPRKPIEQFDESALTKNQLRKLNALRNSLGEKIADKAFAQWLSKQGDSGVEPGDKAAILIAQTLEPLTVSGKLKIPRGGYVVRRGRGRVMVERARS